HHAWLFTGTRGVGKTTLSRILAKSLNCQTGITATPCGVCSACTEIDSGRFVDYVELDAASNRGVDEMTQLLEQAVYAPSVGRFKVYMIDEVHMLTGHAFNAMLKTLEEPPPHVKFILATTDPQKIPVTVLSRCLQFNLKQMTAESMVGHLQEVLGQESIGFETPALRLIAQAASGSMRDALSLTDQAIAYSAGNLTTEAIQGMLGTLDQRYLVRLLQALAAGSGAEVLRVADELATRGLSYTGALADLAVLLSRVAIEQRIAGTVPADDPLAADIAALGQSLHPDLVQLFYSVAVHSRHELSLAPDEYAGFVMACLRMLALAPEPTDAGHLNPAEGGGSAASVPSVASSTPEPSGQVAAAGPAPVSRVAPEPVTPIAPVASIAPAAAPIVPVAPIVPPLPATSIAVAAPAAEATHGQPSITQAPSAESRDIPAWEDAPVGSDEFESMAGTHTQPAAPDTHSAPADLQAQEVEPPIESDGFDSYNDAQEFEVSSELQGFVPVDADDEGFEPAAQIIDEASVAVFASGRKKLKSPKLRDMTAQAWPALAAQLPATGLAAELARQSEWLGVQGDEIQLRVAVLTLAQSPGKARLCTLLSEHFSSVVRLNVAYGATGDETAHAVALAQQAVRQQEAEKAVQADPFVQILVNEFGGQIVPNSIRPAQIVRSA
ncbi:MAG TPA: DNA polymerase III subunit gamma/tau, partial [Eoetvoesiella sp.]